MATSLLLNINNNDYLGYNEIFIFAGRLTDNNQEITPYKHSRVKRRQPSVTISVYGGVDKDFIKVELLGSNLGFFTFKILHIRF